MDKVTWDVTVMQAVGLQKGVVRLCQARGRESRSTRPAVHHFDGFSPLRVIRGLGHGVSLSHNRLIVLIAMSIYI